MGKHRARSGLRPWFVALLLALPVLIGPSAPLRTTVAYEGGVRREAALDALWNKYGDQGGHWTGGDSTASVRLPDGRTAWFFSDTLLGAVNADGSRPKDVPVVHNTMVVQDGATLTTIHGGTPDEPASLVGPTGPGTPDDPQYWVGAALVDGGDLQVLFSRYVQTGPGVLDIRLVGTAVATYSLPDLHRTGLRTLQLSDRVGWGAAVLQDDRYTYVYGTEHAAGGTHAHVARVGRGELLGPWEFWTGAGWSPTEAESSRILGGVGTAFGVAKVGDRYVLISQDHAETFSSELVAYDAAALTGPFDREWFIYTAPEAGDGRIVYDARIHPQLGAGGGLVVSYNVNSFTPGEVYADVHLYRPRFLTVPWPPPS